MLRGKSIKQAEFIKIKELQKLSVPAKHIRLITGRSATSQRTINKSETFKDYQRLNRERTGGKSKLVEMGGGDTDLSKVLITIESWHQETNSLLNDMKKRLDFIESNIVIENRSFLRK